ncbi:GNAT family N-acetyltransferase [Aliikangiella sp. IMCC44359]|uniref:GNAT family N-acetyltransferase n=1 Tax=Aliikangiella sp. IMCC44359 TaxID=3459125 RepID=UPI00403B0CF7
MSEIRQAVQQDLKLIVNWTIKLHQHEDDGVLPVSDDLSEKLTQWLTKEMQNPNCLFLVAEVNQQPIGFIMACSIINDNGFLKSQIKGLIQLLWVDEKYRKSTVGKSLVNEILTCFKEINISHVECSYTANNQLAKNFWQSIGFIESSMTARKVL